MAGDRCRQFCNNGEGSSDVRRWQCQLPKGAAHGEAMQSRMQEMHGEGDVVSARMRLLYDYRAPAGTRWSPTAEQLRELLALFHVGGLRTPSTSQISRITARLRAHGRIEGRNVFYWFQNQKARERKRRLQLMQAPATALPSENTTSSMDGEPLSSSQLPPAEAVQSMMMHAHEQLQPKRCRFQEAHFEAGRCSSRASTPEKIDCAVPSHQLWPCSQHRHGSAPDIPLAVAERVVQLEEEKGLLMHDNYQADSKIMSNSWSITRIKHSHLSSAMAQAPLIDDMAAEDEKSEVSDANVQHSASLFANFMLRAGKMHCSPCMGDEIDSVAATETHMVEVQAPSLHESSQSSEPTCSPSALTLFPLSPTSSPSHNHHHNFLMSPTSSSPSHNHHQNFLRSAMHGKNQALKHAGILPTLCMQSSMLELKLSIDS